MEINEHMDTFYTTERLENFRKIFLAIKKKTNEILLPYDDVSYKENPSVDIETIALNNGIIKIERVLPSDIPEKHATLGSNIIKLNKRDSRREQRFSIAHELEHLIMQKADKLKKTNELKKTNVQNILFLFKINKQYLRYVRDAAKEEMPVLGRSNYKSLMKKLKKSHNFNNIAIYAAEIVSSNLGKYILPDKALNSIAKILYTEPSYPLKPSNKNNLNETFIKKVIDDLFNEEIADYFAANILVPTERFIVWENKSDGKIARKFNVPKSCIKKRREEIPFEIDFLTINNSNYGDNIKSS